MALPGGIMIADSDVEVRTLYNRLTRVKKTCDHGTLVPDEWLKDALKKRELELENLIVLRTGVNGQNQYKVIKEILVKKVSIVEAEDSNEALILASKGKTKDEWSEEHIVSQKVEEIIE